uniref:Uncharacterized protein n=1 Tax=Oryza nivara TaxID=4536 RepID=A0A0E0IV78_ORYNI
MGGRGRGGLWALLPSLNTVHTGSTPPTTSLLAAPVHACTVPPLTLLHLQLCLAPPPPARSIAARLGYCPAASTALPA